MGSSKLARSRLARGTLFSGRCLCVAPFFLLLFFLSFSSFLSFGFNNDHDTYAPRGDKVGSARVSRVPLEDEIGGRFAYVGR